VINIEQETDMNELVIALKIYFASNFVLYVKTHGAHVNVTGMFFTQLHDLFGDQYQDLQAQIDTIGEKLRVLDVMAPLSMTEITQQSAIDDFVGTSDAKGYLGRLLADHEKMAIVIKKSFDRAVEAKQEGIANYLSERLDAHAKMAWMLRSTLQ